MEKLNSFHVRRLRQAAVNVLLLITGIFGAVICLLLWLIDILFGFVVLQVFLLCGVVALIYGFIERHIHKVQPSI